MTRAEINLDRPDCQDFQLTLESFGGVAVVCVRHPSLEHPCWIPTSAIKAMIPREAEELAAQPYDENARVSTAAKFATKSGTRKTKQ